MPKNIIILLFVILFIFFNNPLYSELQQVTLKECINIALQNHPGIKASFEDNNKARADHEVAKAGKRAAVNLELKTVEYLLADEKGNQVAPKSGAIRIPGRDSIIGIFAGPTIVYNLVDPQKSETIDVSKLAIDLVKMKSIKVKEDIILNVKMNYYSYLFANANRALREKLVEKFKIKLDKAKLLFNTGQRPILDVTKSDVDLADARLEYEKAKNQEYIIKTELLTSMGILQDDIEFSPVKVEELPEMGFSFNELNRLAEAYNPNIKMVQLTKEINKLNISAAKAGHSPKVDLYGSIGVENTNIFNLENKSDAGEWKEEAGIDNWELSSTIGLKAWINLWSGGGIEARVNSAIAEYNKSKYSEREVLMKMRAMMRNYFQSLGEYKRQIELSALVIDNAKKHLQLAQKSYENGISSQLEMQDAEMAVLRAELSVIKTRYDYLIALAQIANVVGLGEEYLCSTQKTEKQ